MNKLRRDLSYLNMNNKKHSYCWESRSHCIVSNSSATCWQWLL